jgi:hypothetical protein
MNLNTEAGVLLPWVIQEIKPLTPILLKLLTVNCTCFIMPFQEYFEELEQRSVEFKIKGRFKLEK